MSLKFTAGDLTVHRIIEQETIFLPAHDLLPRLTPEVLAENRAWMKQARALDDTDTLILPIHFPTPTVGLIKADGDRFDYRFKRE